MKTFQLFLLVSAIIGCVDRGPPAGRDNSSPDSQTAEPTEVDPTDGKEIVPEGQEPDNTGVNVRDRDKSLKTPVDQFENGGDIEITAGIRTRIVAEDMSVAAHNIKIITQYGRVTLRGPVRTEHEKQVIQEIAGEIAGSDNVDSQLEVAPE